ncbi:MAG TPA: hypothetical protein VIN58_22600 [Roseateles sp.]
MRAAVICSLLLAALGASAQPQGGPPPPPDGGHLGPPPEALAACKTAKAGADCSFTHEGRALKGSCWAPEGRPLACRPKDAPPPPGASAPPLRGASRPR